MDADPPADLGDLGEATAHLYHGLGHACELHGHMVRGDDWADAGDLLEGMAVNWRLALKALGLERPPELLLPAEAADLWIALEASLVLGQSEDLDDAALTMEDSEVGRRVLRFGSRQVFPNWEEMLDAAWRETLHVDGRSWSERPDDWPQAERVDRPRRLERPRGSELLEYGGRTLSAATALYQSLEPDGRVLSAPETAAVRAQMLEIARCTRTIDIASEHVFPEDYWAGCRLALAMAHELLRGFALSISTNESFRPVAPNIQEIRLRGFILDRRAKGATYEEAYAELLELAG